MGNDLGTTALSYSDALRYRAVVVEMANTTATLRTVAALDDDAIQYLKRTLRKTDIQATHIPEKEFVELLQRTYPPLTNGSSAQDTKTALLRLIDEAYNAHVTDLHFEIKVNGVGRIRSRRDGRIQARLTKHVPADILEAYVNIIALESNTTNDTKHPGGGWQIHLPESGRTVDLRVQILTTKRGREASLRLTGTDARLFRLDALHIPEKTYAALTQILRSLTGAIIVVGPVNSGKSTVQRAISLYVADLIEALSEGREEARIVSLEKPVELEQEFTQIELTDGGDLTFEAMTSIVVRTDYDYLNIGEINIENVGMFFSAALAGRLVGGSFHARDAITALTRIIDMGVPVSTIDNGLRAILYTRTVPRLCRECRIKKGLELHNKSLFVRLFQNVSIPDTVFDVGDDPSCKTCNGVGTTGFAPFFELLRVDNDLMTALRKHGTHEELFTVAHKNGFRQLAEYILDALKTGDISQSSAVTLLHS